MQIITISRLFWQAYLDSIEYLRWSFYDIICRNSPSWMFDWVLNVPRVISHFMILQLKRAFFHEKEMLISSMYMTETNILDKHSVFCNYFFWKWKQIVIDNLPHKTPLKSIPASTFTLYKRNKCIYVCCNIKIEIYFS